MVAAISFVTGIVVGTVCGIVIVALCNSAKDISPHFYDDYSDDKNTDKDKD